MSPARRAWLDEDVPGWDVRIRTNFTQQQKSAADPLDQIEATIAAQSGGDGWLAKAHALHAYVDTHTLLGSLQLFRRNRSRSSAA